MKRVENKHTREVQYRTGDLVMLSTKNIKRNGPGVKKLMPVFMGPFEEDRMVGQAAEKLRLPEEHAVPPPPEQWLKVEPLYKVDNLLDH
eukprot:858245-Pelagomonas_calceolata.AAC.2